MVGQKHDFLCLRLPITLKKPIHRVSKGVILSGAGICSARYTKHMVDLQSFGCGLGEPSLVGLVATQSS